MVHFLLFQVVHYTVLILLLISPILQHRSLTYHRLMQVISLTFSPVILNIQRTNSIYPFHFLHYCCHNLQYFICQIPQNFIIHLYSLLIYIYPFLEGLFIPFFHFCVSVTFFLPEELSLKNFTLHLSVKLLFHVKFFFQKLFLGMILKHSENLKEFCKEILYVPYLEIE